MGGPFSFPNHLIEAAIVERDSKSKTIGYGGRNSNLCRKEKQKVLVKSSTVSNTVNYFAQARRPDRSYYSGLNKATQSMNCDMTSAD